MKRTVLGRVAAVALALATATTGAGVLVAGLTALPMAAYASSDYTEWMDVRNCPTWKDTLTGAEYYRVPSATAAGSAYTATVSGVSGAAAGNYRPPANALTCEFFINKAEAAAPEVTVVDETIYGKGDGKLTGLPAGAEWRQVGYTFWRAVEGDAVEGLGYGTYEVRYAATATHEASLATTVKVQPGRRFKIAYPADQTGFYVTTTVSDPGWHESFSLGLGLYSGYSKTDDFAFCINGEKVQPGEDGRYKVTNLESDLVISVTGVADVTPPTVDGIEDGKTYCGSASFTVADTTYSAPTVTDGGEVISAGEHGRYTLGAGTHNITVSDAAGNKTQVSVTVTADHVAADGWESDDAAHWHVCRLCSEAFAHAEHDFEWVTDVLPTPEKNGARHQECATCGHRGAQESVSYIAATGYEGIYDGCGHGITLAELPEGASVEYSTDGKSFSATSPQLKDAGEHTVKYRVTVPEVGVVEGAAQVKIAQREVGAEWGAAEFTWDGEKHVPSATATGVVAGDEVVLDVSGATADVNEGAAAHVARVSGLSGASAGNYRLPSEALTCEFFINRAEKAAPAVSGANESVKGKSDGRLTGLSSGMEWRAAGAESWTAASGDACALAPGDYEVRWAATSTHNASPAAKVTIAEGRLLKVALPATQTGYKLTANKSELAWGEKLTLSFSLSEGYSKADGFAVEVNGKPAELDANGRAEVSAEADLVVSVKGVADLDKPVIAGIEDGATYCIGASFTVSDTAGGALTVKDGEKPMEPEADGSYRLGVGTHAVSVSDEAGNVATKTVAVNATHLPDSEGWRSDAAGHWRICSCGEKFDQGGHDLAWVVDREATNKELGEKHEECSTCGYKGATVEIPLVAPKIVEGADQVLEADSGADLTVTSDADFEDFLTVKVDGAELDSAEYSVASGSTVVTVKAPYLQTLAVGSHKLEIVSKNGAAATAFTIKEKEVVPDPTPDPEPDPEPTPDPDPTPTPTPSADSKPSADTKATTAPATAPTTDAKASGSSSPKADSNAKSSAEKASDQKTASTTAVPATDDPAAPAFICALVAAAALLAAKLRRE